MVAAGNGPQVAINERWVADFVTVNRTGLARIGARSAIWTRAKSPEVVSMGESRPGGGDGRAQAVEVMLMIMIL